MRTNLRHGVGRVRWGGRGHRKVLRACWPLKFTKTLGHLSRKSLVSFFYYILSSFYFIRCIQNDFFRAFYCKTFLLFYFFLKKNKQKSNKKHYIIYCLWSWCECTFIRISYLIQTELSIDWCWNKWFEQQQYHQVEYYFRGAGKKTRKMYRGIYCPF